MRHNLPGCLVCSKLLSRKDATHCKKHRLINEETREKYRNARKGKTAWNKGLPAWNKGISAYWALGNKNPNFGKYGPTHPKWTGRTLLTKAIRNCPKYRKWRSDIFTRDNFTCQFCGQKGVYIEADHHPIGFAFILRKYKIKTFEGAMKCKELWTASGRALCRKCHPRPGRLRKIS